jgi:TatD DNase family protein
VLDVGIDLASSRGARERAGELDGVRYTVGLHPNDANRLDEEWPELEHIGRSEDCTAIGETGLDWFRDWTTPAQQILAFERHLQLAIELDRPVVVHCRDAFQATFEVVAGFPRVRGVMHCFSGNRDDARRALDLGLYLSFAGPITYPRADALREAAVYAPLDRVLVETDAPFLPPQGKRGQRNEPAYIVATVERLAALRGLPFEQAARLTSDNAHRLFGA